MSRKKIGIVAAVIAALILALGFVLYQRSVSGEFVPDGDVIALRIRLDTEDDVGLLILDQLVNGRVQSGGISNADGSLQKRGSELFWSWRRAHVDGAPDSLDLSVSFRIITEYVDPNPENVYPQALTRYVEEPVSWEAEFGETYYVTITGDQANGYRAALVS